MSLRESILDAAKKHLRYVRTSGEHNIGGPCPFHKSGQEHRPSFYINLSNGLYYCHACGEKGTFPQFLRKMGESSAKVDLILEQCKKAEVKKPPKALDLRGKFIIKESLLGVFDYCPVKLVTDGFDETLLQNLDVGFDKEYMRITFPIRDLYGNLVGFSGRTVVDEFPRYKVYKSRDLLRFVSNDPDAAAYYSKYDIKSHEYLWNMHNVFPSLFYRGLDTLIVVEGYKACIWMLQQGFENTVALQGSRMSIAQEATICQFDGNVFLMLDNNKAGKEGMLDAGARLVRRGQKVYVCSYPEEVGEGAQPDNLDQNEIMASLDAAQSFIKWRTTSCQSTPRSVDSRWDNRFMDT